MNPGHALRQANATLSSRACKGAAFLNGLLFTARYREHSQHRRVDQVHGRAGIGLEMTRQ